jgi:hypothetical protein
MMHLSTKETVVCMLYDAEKLNNQWRVSKVTTFNDRKKNVDDTYFDFLKIH